MKKIADYRRLLDVDSKVELSTLKARYRQIMKECHPDRFANDQEGLAAAEEKSKEMIEAYHFLVSICPETLSNQLPIYQDTITNSAIVDFEWESQVLTITFLNGSKYEYFSVPKNEYIKFVNADSPARFAKRHIYPKYTYRNILKTTA
ncbi:MAG: KTSC domain-containing protein [Sphingobacterium sp.]|jgi:curved DNA-binding protein CbpA|uniref:KTSC domain-containing protein n=1 Tax=Sphingobacterium tabacisoli TaxID=2044855 RepID=A0ABW5L437_9SPHI|nr:KTSC domain-containing protein [Sphingobacterium tabacisoli]MDR2282824.1 KTSC domain-containing protein [Sphingobacterium sp.]